MLPKQRSVSTLVLVVKCGRNGEWRGGEVSGEGSKQALWLDDGWVWPSNPPPVDTKELKISIQGWIQKSWILVWIYHQRQIKIREGIKVTMVLFACSMFCLYTSHFSCAWWLIVLGENVIGYLWGKGDNYLCNPPVTPWPHHMGPCGPKLGRFAPHTLTHTSLLHFIDA